MTGERKRTRFELCDRHAPWFAGQGRYRTVECLCEGGPGGGARGACEGGQCRLWPGRDLFEASVCTSEMDLEWTREREEAIAG